MTLTETVLAGGVLVATALSNVSQAQSEQQTVKNIILVHGAFADGTSWAKVIPILESRGFHVVAVQNPLTSLADDVNATRRISLCRTARSSLWATPGAELLSPKFDDPKVAGLVYLAAYVPDPGTSANETSAPLAQRAIQVDPHHFASMSSEGILNSFAEGLPLAERRLIRGTRPDLRPDVRREVDPRGVEVEAILACNRYR